jgi:hypothetical protein
MSGSRRLTKADEYRSLAEKCLELARTVSTVQTRAELLHMAEVWTRLAGEEGAKGQQQQQIQPKKKE